MGEGVLVLVDNIARLDSRDGWQFGFGVTVMLVDSDWMRDLWPLEGL